MVLMEYQYYGAYFVTDYRVYIKSSFCEIVYQYFEGLKKLLILPNMKDNLNSVWLKRF